MREPRLFVAGRYLVWIACMVFVPGNDCPPDAATCATAPRGESNRRVFVGFNRFDEVQSRRDSRWFIATDFRPCFPIVWVGDADGIGERLQRMHICTMPVSVIVVTDSVGKAETGRRGHCRAVSDMLSSNLNNVHGMGWDGMERIRTR